MEFHDLCICLSWVWKREALDTFSEMKICGEKPNAVTFLGVLSACGHAAFLSEAHSQFVSMYQNHSIVPSNSIVPSKGHFACMVDILCRAGKN